VTFVVFAPASRYFYRKTSLTTERVSASWIAAIVVALSTSTWIGLFSYKHVSYSEKLWWSFAFSHDAPRFLRATAGSLVLLLLFAVVRLLRTTSPRALAETAVDAARVAKLIESSKDTYANLALLGDKSFLFSKSKKTFVMYAVQGRSWVVLGDPIGSTEERSELLWDFLEQVDKHDGWPVFYEVGAANLPTYLDLGLGLFKIGEEARIPLADFSLEGGRHKSLRQTKNRLEAAGCRFEIVPRETVSTLLDELAVVSDAWLSAKNTKEKGFSLGFFDATYLLNFPVALVRHQGQIVAFANVWQGADFEELSVDLMRFTPEAPAGLMDYLFVELLLYARAEGYRWFNLGMAPLSGLRDRALAPLWTKLGAFVFRHGDQFYHFKGLRDYKEKFDPVWEPKYVASPGGLALPRILSNVATLVSRGKKGIGSK
jgi:phosphatidylglycerol lysyltransferase